MQDLTEMHKLQLKEWHFELQDWFSQKVNEVLYKKRIRDFEYIFVRERKIMALRAVIEALKTLRTDLNYARTDKIKNLSTTIKKLGLPVRVTIKDKIASIEREIKGYETAINIKAKDHKPEGVENWLKMVTIASKKRGYRVDPKQTTLAEWVEIIKDIQK
jgi:hypothetical protein